MLRNILLLILTVLVVRAVSRALLGMRAGWETGPRRSHPGRGSAQGSSNSSVHMIRDPVCGTYVVQGRALTAIRGGETAWFCSAQCQRAWLSGKA